MGLTPFGIMYETPPPMILSLQIDLVSTQDNQDILNSLQTAVNQQPVWLQLRAIYEVAVPPKPTGLVRRLGPYSQTSAQDLEAKMEGFVCCSDDHANSHQRGWHQHLGALLPSLSSRSVHHLRGLQRRHVDWEAPKHPSNLLKLCLFHGDLVEPH